MKNFKILVVDDEEDILEILEYNFSENNYKVFTARGEDYSQIAVFDAGADDFVTKPISPKVLLKRVEALLKRKGKLSGIKDSEEYEELSVGNLVIDREQYLVKFNGKTIILPRKEFNLLELLATKKGKVFTREEIFDCIWGDTFIGDRTIDVHVRKLREKLGEDSIITVKGVGYKINSDFFDRNV